MSDFKIPELPSDDELGITEDDRQKYGGDDKPELSAKEMAELLGEAPKPPPKAPPAAKLPPKDKGGPKPPPEPPPKKAAPAPREPAGPRGRGRGPAMLAALVVATWLTSSYRTLPSPEPANAPDTAFSSARAMANLVEIARRPHPPGSPAHRQVRGYLLERMRDLGLDPSVRVATSMIGRGTTVRAATVRNIVARIPGTASTGTVVLTAHYDGREIARAAGDDGSGVVAILETARALNAGPRLRNDVLLVITDAEELGLLGARAFVAEDPDMADVRAVVSLEMRGGGGPSIMFETGPENGWIVQALKASGARPFANSMSYEVYKSLPNDTDFTPFREAGRQGLNFAAIGRASLYHQTYDSPENLSEATLQHHGENALAVTRWLAGADLGEVNAADVSYVSVPVLGLVTWDLSLALPLAAVLLIAALVVLLPVRKASRRWSGIVVGLVLAAVGVAAAAGAGWGLMRWLPRFHPEFGSLHGSAFHHEGWYVAGLAAFAVALFATLFGAARRRFSAAELTWGALILPLGAMAYVSFRHPAAAANLQVPAAAAVLAAAVLLLPSRGRLADVAWLLLLGLALPVLAILVPMVEFVWLGLSFRAAPVVGAVLGLTLVLLLPALDRLREPNAWWAPVSSLALAAALVGIGIRAASPDADRPAPSTLTFVYDHGTGEALWVTDASTEPVDAPALAWATGKAGVDFAETRSLERYGLGEREPRVATATPPALVRKPETWVLSDTVVGDVRHLRLAVRSAVGAEMLRLHFPEAGATRLVALNGRPLPIDERPRQVDHWGAPDPVVTLDLEMPAGTLLEMDVVEHLLRPGELVGEESFRRPPELAPDITWLSDRAVLRTPSASLEVIPGPPPFPLDPEDETPPPAVEPAVSGADTLIATPATPDTVAPDSLAVPPDTARVPSPTVAPSTP
ncbi:MAG: aminopeptidase [Gemmatimonadota bacterium]